MAINETIREKASDVATRTRDAGDYLAEYAMAHPIRIAITVGALTWLALRGRSDAQWEGMAEPAWNDEAEAAAERRFDRVRTAASTAAGTARSSMDEFVGDNPIAAGAIAVAVGAALGMLIPRSDVEDRAMGEMRDRAFERASSAVRNLKDNVTDRMAEAAENILSESLAQAKPKAPEPMGRA